MMLLEITVLIYNIKNSKKCMNGCATFSDTIDAGQRRRGIVDKCQIMERF